MRNLEKRLEKLEQAYTRPEPLVVVLDLKLSDKVLGMSLGDVPTEEFFVTPTEGSLLSSSTMNLTGRPATL